MRALALLILVAAGPAPTRAPSQPPPERPAGPGPNRPAGPGADRSAGPGPDRPALTPTREASVLYRVSSTPTTAYEIRITSLAGNARRRIDLPDKNYLLVDQAAKRLAMVSPFEGTVMDVPWSSGLGAQFTLEPDMRFTRRTATTIAGLRCTTYTVQTPSTLGETCITDDGVMLRTLAQNARGQRTAIEAISVSYTPAPASDYAPPPDFQRVAPPRQ